MKWAEKKSSGLDRLPSHGLPPAACRGDRAARGRRGFTLVEILAVIAIAGILMTMVGLSMIQARRLARRTRAQAELRAMVDAWLQYLQTYTDEKYWPGDMQDVEVDYELLKPIIAPQEAATANPRQIMFLEVVLSQNQEYRDPWRQNAYRISFKRLTEDSLVTETAMRTSVSFPNNQRRWP